MRKPVAFHLFDPFDSLILFGRILTLVGFEVVMLDHDQNIFEQLRTQPPPNLIVIEDVDTIEQVSKYAELKSDLATAQIPIIVIYRPSLVTQDMLSMIGADEYVSKPVDLNQLKKYFNIILSVQNETE